MSCQTMLQDDIYGKNLDPTFTFQVIDQMIDQARKLYDPQFDFRVICSNSRHIPPDVVLADMRQALDMIEKFPGLILGYDLVGPEDEGYPLIDFLKANSVHVLIVRS